MDDDPFLQELAKHMREPIRPERPRQWPTRTDVIPLAVFGVGVLLGSVWLALLGLVFLAPSGVRWYRSLP
jgi:hypothetical protein